MSGQLRSERLVPRKHGNGVHPKSLVLARLHSCCRQALRETVRNHTGPCRPNHQRDVGRRPEQLGEIHDPERVGDFPCSASVATGSEPIRALL